MGAKFTGSSIAPDEHAQINLSLDYDGKRDRWNGYDPEDHQRIVEEYAKVDLVSSNCNFTLDHAIGQIPCRQSCDKWNGALIRSPIPPSSLSLLPGQANTEGSEASGWTGLRKTHGSSGESRPIPAINELLLVEDHDRLKLNYVFWNIVVFYIKCTHLVQILYFRLSRVCPSLWFGFPRTGAGTQQRGRGWRQICRWYRHARAELRLQETYHCEESAYQRRHRQGKSSVSPKEFFFQQRCWCVREMHYVDVHTVLRYMRTVLFGGFFGGDSSHSHRNGITV